MGEKYAPLKVKESTKRRVMDDCVKEFVRHHPEFRHYPISQDFIVNKIVDHWLED